MADDAHPAGTWHDTALPIIFIIGVVAVVVYGFAAFFNPTFLSLDYLFGKILQGVHAVVYFFLYYQFGFILKFGIIVLSVLIIGLITYLILRLLEMEKDHVDHVYHKTDHGELEPVVIEEGTGPMLRTAPAPHEVLHGTKPGSVKWEEVLDAIATSNPADWRLAIIEADTILDELLENSGLPGMTLGERLTNADEGNFRTLRDAWDAHMVRNKIAHQGSDFDMTHREAQQTITRYENVFREFEYI